MVRFLVVAGLSFLTALSVLLAVLVGAGWWVAVGVFGLLLLVAFRDVARRRHSILRN
jgi:hypothetical protein